MNNQSKEISPPYFLFALATAPIFLINILLPAHPQTSSHITINDFLDNHLFGLIGFWSSLFPFSSKATANYIGLFGLIFAALAFYKTHKTMTIDPKQYEKLTIAKYLANLFGVAFFFIFFTFAFYFSSTDLASHNRKFSFFGANIFSYSLFSSSMLVLFYLTPLILHRCFLYMPHLLFKRWKDKRARERA